MITYLEAVAAEPKRMEYYHGNGVWNKVAPAHSTTDEKTSEVSRSTLKRTRSEMNSSPLSVMDALPTSHAVKVRYLHPNHKDIQWPLLINTINSNE